MRPAARPGAGRLPGDPPRPRPTADHEWLVVDEGEATVGICACAAEVFGEVVHLRLPGADAGAEAGEACGEITSATAAGVLRTPATGAVPQAGTAPADRPGAVTTGPRTAGRLFRLRVEDTAGALPAVHHRPPCPGR
ncbi:glycine cleavage system protein H [Streptomyces sp. NPDC058733]|uniref:glycine cleavage system protein H n=1 Tax=Streptomyces sp. NPDC058733 TaxID=3346614 RepID=UPI0036941D5B